LRHTLRVHIRVPLQILLEMVNQMPSPIQPRTNYHASYQKDYSHKFVIDQKEKIFFQRGEKSIVLSMLFLRHRITHFDDIYNER
jgi:hypothetical protein